jgi:hypothetical protein
VKRNDRVHTPAGWALVDGPVPAEAPDGEWVEWWAVTLLDDEDDSPKPQLFRREELELEAQAADG